MESKVRAMRPSQRADAEHLLMIKKIHCPVTQILFLLEGFFLSLITTHAAEEFTPIKLIKPFPAIVDPQTVSAAKAQNEIHAEELIIGVTVNGASRAYPINMMCRPSREIVTDTLGGKRIAVTWCHLCHNSLVFLAEQDGKPLTFVVSGMLWKSNLVMQDLETKSLWSHMLGRCMKGELKGTKLETVPCEITTWNDWISRHPNTTSLLLSRTMKRYERDFYSDLSKFVLIHADFQNARAWQLSDLDEQPVINDAFGKKPLLIVFDSESTSARIFSRTIPGLSERPVLTFEAKAKGTIIDKETGSIWTIDKAKAISGPLKGKSLSPLVGTLAKKKAWKSFYPKGSLWHRSEKSKN